jgi:hypothetical protein
MPPSLIRTAFAVTVVGAVALAACGGGKSTSAAGYPPRAPTPPRGHTLAVEAMDDMFMGPAQVRAGLTTIELHNVGPAPHQVQLLRLKPGVATDQALAATKLPNPGALLSLVTASGGANAVAAGASQNVTVDLSAGTYLEVCFVPDADGVPHLAKGMVSVLTVIGDDRPASPPGVVGTATLHNFRFDLPQPFRGSGTLEVVNDGPQPHELAILALAPGKTIDDVTAFLAGPHPAGSAPFTDAGGVGALRPGQTAFVDLHLPPGRYAAVCQVPDPATGKPHLLLGMAASFTVS